ncbi:sigma-54 interaction domain-containing protein [Sporomusa acidovorans]|uniref:Arginine utilization regulatory protein RocR n=1 Tax=Sporomusa acidovorans (strain ATCC 49682 / DSM 3132 / Mol) TaxID=1123286 RepID=A0ABZ3J9G6_SPOA4|nr:sigma 54-interacting transcriptional regulator [Sporomusa acidovorans]OZC16088.1 arginine utilization regulatory protein RocR [Sporomusa acidovorans DSM 3132]SDD87099.1 arginine utilization regulatory protein [Sporomusa acidovorans]
MAFSSVICFLDDNNILRSCESSSDGMPGIWSEYTGKLITDFLDIDVTLASGYARWQGKVLKFVQSKNRMGKGTILFIAACSDHSAIYEQAMDNIAEGIQVFDRNGYLLFCNKGNERIEKMDRAKIIGKHLLDIYELDADFSTILTALKTKAPVINRCDNFKNKYGEMITTMNSGYPLFMDDQLIGAIGLVQDNSTLETYWTRANVFEKYLSKREQGGNHEKRKNFYTLKYYTFNDLIGANTSFAEAVHLARNIALQDCAVLIYGETGTGKELFAQSIHSASKRKYKEFVAINCAAIPESLIEGILFGTEKGTFTGSSDRMGLFEQAEGGTLFLDEINSMALHVQSKLLRVLQEKKFRRVGGLKDIECDVRILSSTNEEPLACIENSRLRRDLYYRINTVTVNIPPLRQRLDDIELLTHYFIKQLSCRYSKKVTTVADQVIETFKAYTWPGNVRELLHVLEYAFNIMEGQRIDLHCLPKYFAVQQSPKTVTGTPAACKPILHHRTLEELMAEYEQKVVIQVLQDYNYNVSKTAQALGIKRQSLQYRLKKYNVRPTE